MRASASGNAGAPETAFLSLTINASDVKCADGAAYRCELFDFSGGVDIVDDTYVEVQGSYILLFIILASACVGTFGQSFLTFESTLFG